ncbi:MAG: DUF3108 domain-containing protein [Gammaproteobacteria bacterium]
MYRGLIVGAALVGAALYAAMPTHATPRDAGPSLTPFEATYTVTRGHIRLGEMSATLHAPVDGVWRYHSHSETSGFVAMFRQITIDEQSTFRMEQGRPVPLAHEYRMGGSRKNRDFSLAFDWVAREVHGVVRGETVTEPLGPGAIDRHSAPLSVALAAAGGRAFPFDVVMVDRGRTREYETAHRGEETLKTDAGEIATVRVLLVRKDEPDRQFRFWFAPALDHVPVRIQSVDDDGKTITLQLKSYTRS